MDCNAINVDSLFSISESNMKSKNQIFNICLDRIVILNFLSFFPVKKRFQSSIVKDLN